MVDKLQSKEQRKYFYTIIILLLISIFLIRYFLIPFLIGQSVQLNIETVYRIFDGLFTSTLVTISLGTFLFWLTPKNKQNAQIKILQPIEIGDTITQARVDTEKWYFNGGSGRYTRTQTLPYLADLARKKNKTIEVLIQIMNPRNIQLCTKYATYRNSLRSASRDRKTCKSVQIDLISTVVSAYMWKNEQPLLDIKLGLKDNFSLFRIDISSSTAIITKEDPLEPAILYERGTFFYQAHCEDLRQSLTQTESLNMLIPFSDKKNLSIVATKELLHQLKLLEFVTDEEMEEIIDKAKSSKNPYA